jgi:hypothetical protein
MSTFHEILPGDIKTARSFLNQLIDVLQEDISGSTSRRKYQHFVTGGIGPGVTSSLFQTIYDQDFTLQTSNAVFDMTVGIAPPGSLTTSGIADSSFTAVDSFGKYLYPSSSLMMREKVDNYQQFAQMLLGDANNIFTVPLVDGQEVDAAMFLAVKRLFARDQIKRETFALRFYQSASYVSKVGPSNDVPPVADADGVTNLNVTSLSGSHIFTDLGSSTQKFSNVGGEYGIIVDSANVDRKVGLIFYDAGVAVFDLAKIVSGSQFMSGTISAMSNSGYTILGGIGTETQKTAKFIPDFMASGSIDNIVDHLCETRFQSGSLTAYTFQNVTNINSSLIFCKVPSDEFNYSSNPTFIDNNPASNTYGRIVVIDPGQEQTQDTFTYITSIGLYDATGNLLAVAKLSRPVQKNLEKDLTFRVRLDF